MRLSSKIEDKYSIIRFDVDQVLGYEAQEFQDAVLNSLEQQIDCIIVDLATVKFISSWGIGMLIHGLATTTNRGRKFKLVSLTSNVMDVFKKVKIDTVLEIHDNLQNAIAKS
jgi:anti-anti-sigma factor